MAYWQPLSTPPVHDSVRGAHVYAALQETVGSLTNEERTRLNDPDIRALIISVAGNSPFLAGLITRNPEFVGQLVSADPDKLLASLLSTLANEGPALNSAEDLGEALRQAKARVALLTAIMDIAGVWTLEQVTGALSDFADLALQLAVARLLYDRMQSGELAWPSGETQPPSPDLARGSGYAILALGKLGGRELNYSSDIDLIAVFDGHTDIYRGRRSLADCYVRLTQDLVRMMERRTAAGYVFRTDLRLRPDPGATPLAISLGAAETYYQSQGRTWERSAMIKARVAAGDPATGEEFLERVRPFVWRRSLDFAAIRDIHNIKSQVHEHHRHGGIGVAGHDVKLGRGGIREIEFAAQIHQLISGGREPSLRTRATLPTLAEIVQLGKLAREDERALNSAYVFLRTLEHRLQMISDEQTHRLPRNDDEIAHVAGFMGYDTPDRFKQDLLAHLTAVKTIYDRISGVAEARESDESAGAVIPDNPAQALTDLGFSGVDAGVEHIARWRSGRYRALRTERARDLLEGCLARLLTAFSNSSDPDQALTRFDTFLSKIPAGVQIFSLLQANPWLFDLLAKIMGSAPALAEHLARKPQMLDAVLDPGFFDALPDRQELQASLHALLATGRDYQDSLELSRRWLGDMRFQVGVHILEALVDVSGAGRALARLADVTIGELVPRVEEDFAARHGHFPGGDLALIAMGSYGGREITYTSDLDIIFLYDADFSAETSDGKKALSPSLYFSRLGQHVITAITALTAEGKLFEIDMRLRPSGNKGPLVVTLKSFDEYQQQAAWTWEHMALTRARVVRAGPAFGRRIQASVTAALTKARSNDDLKKSVAEMRARLEAEFGTPNPWAVKYVRGGIIDAEFVVQYLLLREGRAHPDIFAPELDRAIDNLAAIGAFETAVADNLKEAVALLRTVQGMLRLCFGGSTTEEAFSSGLRQLLAERTGSTDFGDLRSRLEAAQKFVYALYCQFLD